MILVTEAADLAIRAHAGHLRDDGITPYIEHPAEVAVRVAKAGGSETAVAAAWLHDVVEDVGIDPASIAEALSPEVAALVMELTFMPGTPNRKAVQLERAKTMSKDAKLIKLADITANMFDLPRAGWEPSRTRRYYNHLILMRKSLGAFTTSGEWALEEEFNRAGGIMFEQLLVELNSNPVG